MGFGYLFIGYLIAFVIRVTLQALGIGGLALLVGYGLMLLGLMELSRYHTAFSWAKWTLIPLLLTAVYDTVASLDKLFLWNLPIFGSTASTLFSWLTFLLIMFFNLTVLYAIRMLAREVELKNTEIFAVRNSIFVGLYAVLYLLGNMPLAVMRDFRGYMTMPMVLLNLVWITCNLLLFLSCMKNICRAGDEDMPPKRYRFEWINKIGDAYEDNRRRAIDRTTQEAEEALRRRQAAREEEAEQRKNRKRKHRRK